MITRTVCSVAFSIRDIAGAPVDDLLRLAKQRAATKNGKHYLAVPIRRNDCIGWKLRPIAGK